MFEDIVSLLQAGLGKLAAWLTAVAKWKPNSI
jgi:hypothetical protein